MSRSGRAAASGRRSGCPVSISLELFGDRWSLLIVRDLMVRGYRSFQQFLSSGEGIATNILSDRLARLEADGILSSRPDPSDGRKVIYRLTEKGIDLAPVLLDLLLWAAKYEQTGAPCSMVARMAAGRESVLAEVRRRWETDDPEPFLPRFSDDSSATPAASPGAAGRAQPRTAGLRTAGLRTAGPRTSGSKKITPAKTAQRSRS